MLVESPLYQWVSTAMIADWPVGYYLATKAEPDLSSIERLSSATITIVGLQLTRSGLPAIRDATYMQVNALVHLSAVMMRLKCR
jgi:hypothetical protein